MSSYRAPRCAENYHHGCYGDDDQGNQCKCWCHDEPGDEFREDA